MHQEISHMTTLAPQASLALVLGCQIFIFLRSDVPWHLAFPSFQAESQYAILSHSLVEDGFPGFICSMFPQTLHYYWGAVLLAGEGRMQCTFCCPLPAFPPLHSDLLFPQLASLF